MIEIGFWPEDQFRFATAPWRVALVAVCGGIPGVEFRNVLGAGGRLREATAATCSRVREDCEKARAATSNRVREV